MTESRVQPMHLTTSLFAEPSWLRTGSALQLSLILAAACKGDAVRADSAGPPPGVSDSSAGGSLALPVVGEPVRRGDLVLTVATTGQVQSDAVAQLKAETSGSVDEVLLQPGDRVKKGRPDSTRSAAF